MAHTRWVWGRALHRRSQDACEKSMRPAGSDPLSVVAWDRLTLLHQITILPIESFQPEAHISLLLVGITRPERPNPVGGKFTTR
jgi:hypothetical protein